MSDTTANVTEDFEPAEVSHAKDLVYAEIEQLADKAMIEIGDDSEQVDGLTWADVIVERLLAAGAEFPEDWATRPAPWTPEAQS